MKVLIKVQAEGTKTGGPRRGRPKAGASAGEEKFLEFDVGETVIMIGFPDDEKTSVAVDRQELERALRFVLSA